MILPFYPPFSSCCLLALISLRNSWADEKLHSSVRVDIATALGNLAERSVAPDLVRLLADEKLHSSVGVDIARALGNLAERSVAPDLVRLLADEKLGSYVGGDIARALGNFADDDATVHALVTFLEIPDISDVVYTALWKTSRRAGL